jgi:hypothetical protein
MSSSKLWVECWLLCAVALGQIEHENDAPDSSSLEDAANARSHQRWKDHSSLAVSVRSFRSRCVQLNDVSATPRLGLSDDLPDRPRPSRTLLSGDRTLLAE